MRRLLWVGVAVVLMLTVVACAGPKQVLVAGRQLRTDLTELELTAWTAGSLDAIGELPELRTLTLHVTADTDLAPLKNLPKLTTLTVKGGMGVDLTPLGALSGLEVLVLDILGRVDLSALAGLTNLAELSVTADAFSDWVAWSQEEPPTDALAGLASLTNLRTLSLRGDGLGDLAPLTGLTKVQALSLRGSGIRDLSPLAKLTNLTTLTLIGDVTDLAPLAALPNLDDLTVSGPDHFDVSPLADVPNLGTIHLGDLSLDGWRGDNQQYYLGGRFSTLTLDYDGPATDIWVDDATTGRLEVPTAQDGTAYTYVVAGWRAINIASRRPGISWQPYSQRIMVQNVVIHR